MQKTIELIEQVRFAELKKIDKLSSTQKEYPIQRADCNEASV